jgi:hypothetical protein
MHTTEVSLHLTLELADGCCWQPAYLEYRLFRILACHDDSSSRGIGRGKRGNAMEKDSVEPFVADDQKKRRSSPRS